MYSLEGAKCISHCGNVNKLSFILKQDNFFDSSDTTKLNNKGSLNDPSVFNNFKSFKTIPQNLIKFMSF